MENFIEKLKAKLQNGLKKVIALALVAIIAFAIIVSILIVLITGSFSSRGRGDLGVATQESKGGYAAAPSYPGAGFDNAATDRYMMPVPNEPPASSPNIPTTERKVIQNGSLDLLVKKAEEAVSSIEKIAESRQGFVESSYVYEISEGVKAGNITIRIPATSFTTAMAEIKRLAVKVEKENTNSQDVTAQFVDLEARLKNYKAEEEQYREIMDKAVKIDDILNVSSRLAEVRGRIEQVQGQLNYLSRQVGMSTVSVSLTSEEEVEVFGIVWRPLTVIKQAFKNLLTGLAGFVDWLIYVVIQLPILIIKLGFWVLVIWIFWRIIKWAKKKYFPDLW